MCCGPIATGKDFLITIGGGYEPSGNQASLEANVLFFQQVLNEKGRTDRNHRIHFADGFDTDEDLQVLMTSERNDSPLYQFLAGIHRRNNERVYYRNHRVPHILGANSPDLVRQSIHTLAKEIKTGDRLIMYVTAHGSRARGRDPFNTTIDCWNRESIKVRDMSKWLDELPEDVPVISVMAQCYCGGFSHLIFEDADDDAPLHKQLRIGFFAQQHDLAAAGCRPDIKNDEEFSSYFWGAFVGRTRTGEPMTGCDANGDGKISFAEAYAHTVIESNTIDIPLTSSDILLRTYSKIRNYELRNFRNQPNTDDDNNSTSAEEDLQQDETESGDSLADNEEDLMSLDKTLEDLASLAASHHKRIILELGAELGFETSDTGLNVVEKHRTHIVEERPFGRRGFRGRERSGRRELLTELEKNWPEIADTNTWEDSAILKSSDHESLLAEIRQLPGYDIYSERLEEREKSTKQRTEHELRGVKLRRLIDTLEVVVLAQNLKQLAPPEILQQYERMLEVETQSL